MTRSRTPQPELPTWDVSEEWAYALREQRTYLTGRAETELDIWHWQGEQKAALLLAVLHMVAACSGRLDDPWLLRRWLTVGAERDTDEVVARLVARVRVAIAMLDPGGVPAARLRHAWGCLTVPTGDLPPSRRLHLAAACVHARWLLDAELVSTRGGLLPHSCVRITGRAAARRSAVVHDLYWLDDGGPPVGYLVRLDGRGTRVEVAAGALEATGQTRPAGSVPRRRGFRHRGHAATPDG
jgi:hypothetical protein